MYGAMAGARLSTFLIRASTLSAHRTKSGAGKFWAEHDPGGEIRPAAPEHRVHNMPLPPRRQRIGLSVPGLIPECRDPPRRSASFMKIRCGKAADFWLAGVSGWESPCPARTPGRSSVPQMTAPETRMPAAHQNAVV